MKKSIWKSLGLFVSAIAVGSAISIPSTAADTSAPAATQEIKVTTFPQTSFLSVWVAQARGFDLKRHVKIKDISTAGGNTLYTPLVGGQADASILLPELAVQFADRGIVAAGNGRMAVLPALTVRATETHPATAIVVRNGIRNVKGLVGKTIATHNVVSGFYTLAKVTLRTKGIKIDNNDPSATHVTVLPMGLMGNALRLGKIDAAVMDYYTASAAVASGDGRILMPVMGAGEWKDYPYALWAFNRQFYESNQESVKNFLLTLLDANEWILNHPQEAKQILASKLGTPAKLASDVMPSYPMDGYTTDLRVDLNKTCFTKVYSILKSAGAVTKIRPFDTLLEPANLVDQVQKEWSAKMQ